MPYNPGISYRGDQSLMEGFQGLSRGIDQAGEAMRERKEVEQKGKSAKRAISALQAMGYMEDVDPTALSDRDVIAMLDGGIQAAQYGSQMQQMDYQKQQMDYQKLMGQKLENEMNAPPWQPSSVDLNGDGLHEGYMSSPSSFNLFPQPETPEQLMGPQGPAVQYNGLIGTWDPKLGGYSNWKPQVAGSLMEAGGVKIKSGGGDYSQIPQYNAALLMGPDEYEASSLFVGPTRQGGMMGSQGQPAAQSSKAESVKPSADAGGMPPVEGARKAADGKWYIQKDGQWFRVEM